MHVYNFTWLLNFDFKFKYYHFNIINGLAFSSASGEQAYFMTQWGKKGKSLLLSCPKYVMKQKQPYILTLLVLVLQCKHLCALSWLVLKTRSGLLRHQREKVKKKKKENQKVTLHDQVIGCMFYLKITLSIHWAIHTILLKMTFFTWNQWKE